MRAKTVTARAQQRVKLFDGTELYLIRPGIVGQDEVEICSPTSYDIITVPLDALRDALKQFKPARKRKK